MVAQLSFRVAEECDAKIASLCRSVEHRDNDGHELISLPSMDGCVPSCRRLLFLAQMPPEVSGPCVDYLKGSFIYDVSKI